MRKVKTKAELKALCDDLSANLYDINTSDITDMSGLFKDSLRSDFSFINKWNTSKVTDMSSMFENCVNLNEKLKLNAKSLKNTCKMFYGCGNLDLKNIRLTNFDATKLDKSNQMLISCKNKSDFIVRHIALNYQNSKIIPKNQSEFDFILNDDSISLALIDSSNIKDINKSKSYKQALSKETRANKVYKYKPKNKDELKKLVRDSSIHLGDIDTSLITDMNELFLYSTRKDFSGINEWDTSKVTDMGAMFFGSDFNEELSFDTSNVSNMDSMFYRCKKFNKSLDLDTSKVTSMNKMFYKCENFNQSLSFDTSKVTDMKWMFCECKSLNQKLDFDTKNVTNMKGMFYECKSFNQKLNFDTSKVTDMSDMFYGCKSFNQKINFNTSKVKTMSSMFAFCDSFNQNLSHLDTRNVTNMNFMFMGCSSLRKRPRFDISGVRFGIMMFSLCWNLDSDDSDDELEDDEEIKVTKKTTSRINHKMSINNGDITIMIDNGDVKIYKND